MPKYAYFDKNTRMVLQWIDTDIQSFILPETSYLHECTEIEWEMQFEHAALIECNGKLKPYQQTLPDTSHLRELMVHKIQLERDRRTQYGGYVLNGKWFHSDPKSRSQQQALVLLGSNLPPGLQWKTMDGSFIAMTTQLAQRLLAAAMASDIAIFEAAEAHRRAMEASADPGAYDFSAGWPLMFGEEDM